MKRKEKTPPRSAKAATLLICAVAFVVVWGALLDIRDARNARKIASQSEMLEDAYTQLEDLNGTLRAQRHDFKNHMQVVFGLIGFFDDYEKVHKKRNLGLTAGQKFLLQVAAAIAFLQLMRLEGMLSPSLYVPFLQTTIHLNWFVYMVFAAFVIVGTVNAVNLTDGLDGLATSVTIPVALFFVSVATWWGYRQLGVFAGAMLGGLLGFLIFNAHPAKVFMGDTGSLFLGGAVAALTFAFDIPLILILVGIIYILETLSDIIQVAYFKATHGKRFFKMAPLHHHFELCGWSEMKIVVVFTSISAVFCALAYFGAMGRSFMG